jgi:hypothetical protein
LYYHFLDARKPFSERTGHWQMGEIIFSLAAELDVANIELLNKIYRQPAAT